MLTIRAKSPLAEKVAGFALDLAPSHFERVEEPAKVEPPKNEPVLPLWQRFVASVKSSDMTDAMKVACVAQAILESGRGTSRVSKELTNFWGIKWREVLEGLGEPMRIEVTSETQGWDIFTKFPNTDTAVKGWLKFLTREYYVGWEAFKDNSEGFIRHIGKAWCPAPDYAEKVIRCIGEAEMLLAIKSAPVSKKAKRVLTDPGHSDKHPGAVSNNGLVHEEILNREQAKVFKQGLEAAGHICDIYDPADDNIAEIGQRAKGYDAFVSFHHNCYEGAGDPGTEVFVTTFASAAQEAIAKKVCDAICKELGTINRGVKRKNWTVINEADKLIDGPVMLIESYFINPYSPEKALDMSKRAALITSKIFVEEWK